MSEHADLPVVVIGAGPIGLAAAANLRSRGLDFIVLESGDHAGAAVREWSHIRLFSSWAELVDPVAVRLLGDAGWDQPDPEGYPSGGEWATLYLQPLADILGDAVRYRTRVTGVTKRGRDLVVDSDRDTEPFTVHVTTPTGDDRIAARAVIDAAGTWQRPNPLGADGLMAAGETAARPQISYRVPDLTDAAVRDRYTDKHIAVAGTGASAKTALITLAALAGRTPATRISWIVRRASTGNAFGGGADDELPRRGALGEQAKAAAGGPAVRTVTGFRVAAITPAANGRLRLESLDGQRIDDVDEIIALTGFRPDLSILSEIRLDLDPTLQSPRTLAPLIDPNVHSCGTVYPHGAKELVQPETDFYLLGMKSYGRATSFLALTGYEQARSVVAEIAGDHDAAARVELSLPESGVCGGTGSYDDATSEAGLCCGTPAGAAPIELVSLSTRPRMPSVAP